MTHVLVEHTLRESITSKNMKNDSLTPGIISYRTENGSRHFVAATDGPTVLALLLISGVAATLQRTQTFPEACSGAIQLNHRYLHECL